MTIYPVDFHRRTEQRWARRAQLSRESETLRHSRLLHSCGLSASDVRQHGAPSGPSLLSGNASTDADRGSAERRTAPINACGRAGR
jgi:hypothetical protein